jgi:O-acetylserine/cysteine efflux transporter
MTHVPARDLGLLVAITLIWGLNLVVSKFGLEELPPLVFSALRFAVVAACTFPFLRVIRGRMGAMVVAALLAGGLNFALLFAGLALAENVSAVAIASQLTVPFTTLLSVGLLGETVRWRRWSGIALSFTGVLVMGLDPAAFAYWPSLLLVVASALVGSLGVIALKRLPGFAPLEIQAWFSWISLPVLGVLALLIEQPTAAGLADVSWRAWGALAYTALLGTLVGHTVFFHLVSRHPVTRIAPLTVLSPVFSVCFAIWLLDDELTLRLVVGGALTLAGVVIISLREHRLADTGS